VDLLDALDLTGSVSSELDCSSPPDSLRGYIWACAMVFFKMLCGLAGARVVVSCLCLSQRKSTIVFWLELVKLCLPNSF